MTNTRDLGSGVSSTRRGFTSEPSMNLKGVWVQNFQTRGGVSVILLKITSLLAKPVSHTSTVFIVPLVFCKKKSALGFIQFHLPANNVLD